MASLIERLLVVCTAVTHLHGIEITGSAFGFIQAGVAVTVMLFAVVPAVLSVFDRRKLPAILIVGELVAGLLLFGASERMLHESVHAHIVGTGDTRVLALRASVIPEAVE